MSDAFHELELAGWQRVAAAYPMAFGQLTTQAIEPLLDAVNAGPGTRLLDVATGPGYVASVAARRGAEVSAVDFARAMVEAAQRMHPAIDVREADACALPFDAGTFDAVVVSFGLLHFARPESALAEMRRVLRPGGRVACTVWAPPARTHGFRIILDAIAAHGSADVAPAEGPPFFRFSDPGEFERALHAAGFSSASVVELPMIWRLPSPDALFDAMTEGSVRTAALIRAQSPDARAAIKKAVRSEAARFEHDGTVELPMPCVLASAVAQ